ncbi:MAG: DUF1508 domain-containing protein [Bacillota bacterium]
METLNNIWSNIVSYAKEGFAFLQEGNNLYYFIAAVAAVFILIIAIVVLIVKKKKKASSSEDVQDETIEVAYPTETKSTKVESLEETAAPFADHSSALAPTEEVEVKVEEEEAAPVLVVEDIKDTKEEPEIVRSVVVRPVKRQKAKTEAEAPVAEEAPAPAVVEEEEKAPKGTRTLSGYVQIYKDKGGKFRFRIKSSNKGIVAHSQGYTTKSACKNGIKAVANASLTAPTVDTTKSDYVVTIGKAAFEIFRDVNGKYYFRLRAANTSNVLSSQGYSSKVNCVNGIESVKFLSNNYTLVDDTLIKKA